jgi:hypothetical protein
MPWTSLKLEIFTFLSCQDPLQLHLLDPSVVSIMVGLLSVFFVARGIKLSTSPQCACATISITTIIFVPFITPRSSLLILLPSSFFFHKIFNYFAMVDVEKTEVVSELEGNAPQGMRYVHIDPALQKRVVRKLDFNLMPMVMALCKSTLSSIHPSDMSCETDSLAKISCLPLIAATLAMQTPLG